MKDTDLNVAPSNWLRDGRFSDVGNSKSDPIELTRSVFETRREKLAPDS